MNVKISKSQVDDQWYDIINQSPLVT
jgi:hypothetical protein